MGQYEEALQLSSLCKAAKQCRRGSGWKGGVIDWYTHRLTQCKKLKDDIEGRRYKLRPGKVVKITRPKPREAIAPYFRDRVWQRVMCNAGVYKDLTCGLIYDNAACQIGKGTDFAIRRTVMMLRRMYIQSGTTGYGVHIDIRKYFPSTPHAAVLGLESRKITEERFLPYLEEICESVKDKRAPEEVAADPHGERGTGLGSQINQLVQAALLDHIDRKVKQICKLYMRYQDDFLILDADKEKIRRARDIILLELKKMGFEAKGRTEVFSPANGFEWLGRRFILTKTGKVVQRMKRGTMKRERRVLKHMLHMEKSGRQTPEDTELHYIGWRRTYSFAGSGALIKMDRYYSNLFRRKAPKGDRNGC